MKILIQEDTITQFVQETLIPALRTFTIFTFQGPLGVGKTTIIKELFRQCGIQQTITSPTFGYVNTYTNQVNTTFYHFDLYRIDSLEAFLSLGFDEYLYKKNSICILEWPEIIQPLLQEKDLASCVFPIILEYDIANFHQRSALLKKA